MRSDETTISTSGPAGPRLDNKYNKIEEKLDVKLNSYLLKWIIIILYYKVTWIFSVLGWILPAMTLIKLAIAVCILLPQFKGEFYAYHLLESYILSAEKIIL